MPSFITRELDKITREGLLRQTRLVEGPTGTTVTMDGEEKLLFCSNDYLGLANNTEVKEAAIEATLRYGTGAGASRLVSGTMTLHEELEERIRRFKKAEAVLLFNSGYSANTGAITAITDRNTEIFSDRLNHASIVDGALLSRARLRRYPHNDITALEGLLKASKAPRKLIITEGVFSMDGDVAPLREIITLLEPYNAYLYLDEAHAAGALGPTGRGTLEALSIPGGNPRVIEMGTLGKAFGSFGAYVSCTTQLKTLLTTKARSFIYTTALPPAQCAASIKAIDIVEEHPELAGLLQNKAAYMRAAIQALGFNTMGSLTQIIPIFIGDTRRAVEISGAIFRKGIFIQGIRPPTVPEGTARLRLTVSLSHMQAEMERALRVIGDCMGEPYRVCRACGGGGCVGECE